MANPNQVTPSQEGLEVHATSKAKMLISILGADFAKSSDHPFFRKLAETALHAPDDASPEKLGNALQTLVERLADPDAPRTPKPEVKAPAPQTQQLPKIDPGEHPAIIASMLGSATADQKRLAMKSLPRQTARRVAVYLNELDR
jgi:hypothetical protein